MQCSLCPKKATSHFRHLRPLCDNCFAHTLEKRLRKYIRINKWITKGDRLVVIDRVSEYFLKRIIKDLPVKIIKKDMDPNKLIQKRAKAGKSKILLPWTLDNEGTAFLETYFKNKKRKKLPKNCIRFLKVLSEEEIDFLAKAKKLKVKKIIIDKDIHAFINKVEAINPAAKFGLAKSAEKFEELKI
jgi:hypothetical protein